MSRSLNRMFRKACNACGDDALDWLGLVDAIDRCGVTFVREALEDLGCAGDELEVWVCPSCGERGAFGALQYG